MPRFKKKRESLPLHLICCIPVSAQRIPSVHSFYGLHALYLAIVSPAVWQRSSPLPLSTHLGNESFSLIGLCLLRNPRSRAQSERLRIIHLINSYLEGCQDEFHLAGPVLDVLHCYVHQPLPTASTSRDADWCNQAGPSLSYTALRKSQQESCGFLWIKPT